MPDQRGVFWIRTVERNRRDAASKHCAELEATDFNFDHLSVTETDLFGNP